MHFLEKVDDEVNKGSLIGDKIAVLFLLDLVTFEKLGSSRDFCLNHYFATVTGIK